MIYCAIPSCHFFLWTAAGNHTAVYLRMKTMVYSPSTVQQWPGIPQYTPCSSIGCTGCLGYPQLPTVQRPSLNLVALGTSNAYRSDWIGSLQSLASNFSACSNTLCIFMCFPVCFAIPGLPIFCLTSMVVQPFPICRLGMWQCPETTFHR